MLQVALNGGRSKADHLAVPITEEELVAAALACRRVGAREFHVHPRDPSGAETLHAETIDRVAARLHAATGLPVGVSTGAWIEPDVERRIADVREWTRPTYASVNVGEDGAAEVMAVLLDAGIGIEAGVWNPDDVALLAGTGLADRVLRVLVEVHDPADVGALGRAQAIHDALDEHLVIAPRLQHGVGPGAWVLIRDAAERGVDTRVGFEDSLFGPRGGVPRDNADLVDEAQAIIGRTLLRAGRAA